VRGREVAGTAEPREVAKERRVEIYAPVAGAIERPGRGAGESARRLNRAVEQFEERRRIPPTLLRKDLAPRVLGAAQDGCDELAVVIVRRQWRALAAARRDTAAAQELQYRIGSTDEIRDRQQRDRAEAAADAAPHAKRQPDAPARAAHAALVANVVTAAQIPPAHGSAPAACPAVSLSE